MGHKFGIYEHIHAEKPPGSALVSLPKFYAVLVSLIENNHRAVLFSVKEEIARKVYLFNLYKTSC